MGLATHIVVSKVHFWVIWESGKFGLKKGTGVDPRPPLVDNVPFFYRFFLMRASLTLVRNLLWSSPWCPHDHLGSIDRLLRLRFKRRLILLRSSPWFPTGLGLLLHGEVVKLTVPFIITSSSVSFMASICPPLAFLVWTSSPSLVSAPPSLESALSFFGRPLKKGYSTRINWMR